MSLMRRIFSLLRLSTRCVGRDLEGNRFYEHPGISNDPWRTKRTVQYKVPEDVWKYIGGGKRLPVQWSMWLSHTRRLPPTLEELQQDVERQRRVLANAALIEARDLEERKERLRIEQDLREENAQRTRIKQPTSSDPSPTSVRGADHGPSSSSGSMEGSSHAPAEPESWSPQTLRRGG